MRNVFFALFAMFSIALIGCDDDDTIIDDEPLPTGEETVYDLHEVEGSGVSGTATFAEYDDGSTLVILDLDGTPDDGMHPAHIHMNSAEETGDIVIDLESVDGATGMSETFITQTNDGDAVSYEDLISYDGYINVHESADNLTTVVAQGNIGENALTGEETTYDLSEIDDSGVSGTATFEERVNGETIVTLDLEGTMDGDMHPAHIHMNSAEETGEIVISLDPVDGTTGMSISYISNFDDEIEGDPEFEGDAVMYDDLIDYNGYINVHLSSDDLTVVAQGNIGSNAD